MDSNDFNAYNRDHGPMIQFELPPIVSISYKQVKFKAPVLKNFESSLSKYKEAVEIIVITETPIPIRAAAAVLYIGETRIDYYEPGKNKNEYIFYAFEISKLKEKEVIKWGWNNDPVAKLKPTRFQYMPSKE